MKKILLFLLAFVAMAAFADTSTDSSKTGVPGGGTVTSIGVVGVGGLTITGSPVTSTGTVTVTVGALTPTSVNSSGPVTATSFIGAGTGLTGTAASLTTGAATSISAGATGSLPYQSAAGTTSMLAGNTSATPSFLTSTGSGSVAQTPTFTTSTGSGSVVLATSPSFGTDASSPKWRSTSTKVLFQGLTTGATQLASTQTTVPTCSANCGTSPAVAGSDSDGVVTMGGTGVPASAWVVTFNGTWAAAPSCIVQSALSSMVVGKMPIAVVTTTTTLTVTTNGTAPSTSDKYQYHCRGTS